MTEKLSPEAVLVHIAHTFKEMGYKLGTEKYESLVNQSKFTFLDGQTISEALKGKKEQGEKVLQELAQLANDSFS